MPNRGELAATKQTKAAVAMEEDARPERYWHARQADETGMDGIWLVAGLCVIGVLASIDFAAYFQMLERLQMIVSQVP